MNYKVVILGSTGSIGVTTLNSLYKKKAYKIILLTAKKNIKKLYSQAVKFNVKDVIIEDKKSYNTFKRKFRDKNIRLHFSLKNINKILKKRVSYCINSISGIDGLYPTLKMIPLTQNILIANKESIICGWNFIERKLKFYKTNFIPLDSEHFSIWQLIKNDPHSQIEKVILTASGGPFLKKSNKNISNIKPKFALKHPNWKMGKKISIDSSTMMNKILEFIEAKKIFNLKNKDISILIHPQSFIHAIVFFKGKLIKLLAHETKMSIPISNALDIKQKYNKNEIEKNFKYFNNLKFATPDKKKFPLLSVLNLIPDRSSYFETILITLNDMLVNKYLSGDINYQSIHKNLLNLIKKSYFKKYYKLKPNNIYDIKRMIDISKKYLKKNIKYYD
tara:strand:+ start:5713 stop:6882 length:1170 start_codon:yes stop_codon:yes gene_type:complete